jgi:hypothetical protein
MKKAKTITKQLFRGLGSSKVAPSVEHSNHGTKPHPTASQSVEAVSTTHSTAVNQTGTGATSNSDDHAGSIAVPPEVKPSNFDPSSPTSPAIASPIQTPKSTLPKSKECMVMPRRISRSLTELDVAATEFRENYELFAKKHPDVLLFEDEFNTAFRSAEVSDDIKRSAQIFGDGIRAVLQTMETKKSIGKPAWQTKLGTFLAKVYPVAMLSLNLTASVSEVPSRTSQF